MALQIQFTKQAYKEFSKAPYYVQETVGVWLMNVRNMGIEQTRIHGGKGLHDEPLKGNRTGQRSIRLNRSWRLIYEIENGELHIIKILSVTKHDYR